jgi:hypothetical protein
VSYTKLCITEDKDTWDDNKNGRPEDPKSFFPLQKQVIDLQNLSELTFVTEEPHLKWS